MNITQNLTLHQSKIWQPNHNKNYRQQEHNNNKKILPYTTKDKAVPLQAWIGPQGSRKFRFPNFMTMEKDGAKYIIIKVRQ